jgi:lipoyl(octanoyl) transferase
MRRVLVRDLGKTDYLPVFNQMRDYTRARNSESIDEIWLTEHLPVFTMGQSAKKEHLLSPGEIPISYCDRGGQVTYHGPGQLTVYLLLDIKRMSVNIRELVARIESSMIGCLSRFSIQANRIQGAPGVYVDRKKIGALGLRVTRGRVYHGMSLNVDMSLEPFSRINPCGLLDISVTQIADFQKIDMESAKVALLDELADVFDINLNILDNLVPELG